ncbi:hypothetical protein HDU81_009979 [Chytriomyces hyalinus]|nr:hypothetical protein HDU81_009979 [Chytriomyces hyalinus]
MPSTITRVMANLHSPEFKVVAAIASGLAGAAVAFGAPSGTFSNDARLSQLRPEPRAFLPTHSTLRSMSLHT